MIYMVVSGFVGFIGHVPSDEEEYTEVMLWLLIAFMFRYFNLKLSLSLSEAKALILQHDFLVIVYQD